MKRLALGIAVIVIALLALRAGVASQTRLFCSVAPVVRSQDAIDVRCATWSFDVYSARADLYPLTLDQYSQLHSGAGAAEILRSEKARVRGIRFKSGPMALAQFPAQPIGLYLVHVSAEGGSADLNTSVSSIGTITIGPGTPQAYVPVSLANNRFATDGVTMSAITENGSIPLVKQNDGTFLGISQSGNGDPLVYASARDGSIAFAQDGYGAETAQSTTFLQTDRPIYRPGDLVHLRVILRRGDVGAYTIDREEQALVVATGYPRHVIAHRSLTPDAFGTIAADVRLQDDAQLGNYDVTVDGMQTGSFAVQAYRKPEYTVTIHAPEHVVIGGDSATFKMHVAYLFGAPAGGFTVQCAASTVYWRVPWFGPYSSFYPRNVQPQPYFEQSATTDANGNAACTMPSKHADYPAYIDAQFDVRDESGRTVSAQSQAEIVPGEFAIAMTPDSWFATPKEQTLVRLTTIGYDGVARAGTRVSVHIFEWKRGGDVDRGSLAVTTDTRGAASFAFTPPEAGSYRYEASAEDARGNKIVATQYQWVPDPNSAWAPPIQQPALIVSKSLFEPGETAHVLLALAKPDSDALIVISTNRVIERRLLHVAGSTADIAFTPPPGAQTMTVEAYVLGDDGVSGASANVAIDPSPTTLRIHVTGEKPSYEPGEMARFHVHVTDDRGRPVHAQLGIGVVDAAIYALAPAVADAHGAFYQRSTYAYALPDWSNQRLGLLSTVARVTARDVYAVPKSSAGQGIPAPIAAMPAMTLRTNFADTAYWSPAVVTDVYGNAMVSLRWPDDLTTWVSTALGVTTQTQIGIAKTDTLVTKPFLVRLEAPRFLRAGDRSQITGIAQGKKPGTPVRLELEAPAFGVREQERLTLDDNGRAHAAWALAAPGVGSATLALRGTDETLTDGMQTQLPLLSGTPVEHVRSAGIAQSTATIPTEIQPGQLAGSLSLSFSPSALAEIAQTMREFDVYPYFCTEQTGSAGMVAAAFLQAATRAHIEVPGNPKSVIAHARARLAQLEHADGAWGWWTSDPTNAFMTSYALWSLKLMDAADPDPSQAIRIQNGARWLANDLQSDSSIPPQERALAFFALADAAPDQLPQHMLDDALRGVDRADATSTAFLGLAAAAVGRRDDAERAAAHMRSLATGDGRVRFWRSQYWGSEWWTDPIAETSYAAMLFDAVGAHDDVLSAIAFLRSQRNGDWWYTTADSAAAITVLSDVEHALNAGPTNETVSVRVGDRVVRTVAIRSGLPDASDTRVIIPASEMQAHEPVTIERSGSGILYWSSDFQRYLNRNATSTKDADESVLRRLFAAPPALAVSRRYSVNHAGHWRVGDEVTVTLTVRAGSDAQYVTVEDPYPAGVEFAPLQGQAANASWSGAQFLDDRAAFFFYWLAAGSQVSFQYHLRVTTPGVYAAPGPSAYASYGPPVKAVGTGETVVIQ